MRTRFQIYGFGNPYSCGIRQARAAPCYTPFSRREVRTMSATPETVSNPYPVTRVQAELGPRGSACRTGTGTKAAGSPGRSRPGSTRRRGWRWRAPWSGTPRSHTSKAMRRPTGSALSWRSCLPASVRLGMQPRRPRLSVLDKDERLTWMIIFATIPVGLTGSRSSTPSGPCSPGPPPPRIGHWRPGRRLHRCPHSVLVPDTAIRRPVGIVVIAIGARCPLPVVRSELALPAGERDHLAGRVTAAGACGIARSRAPLLRWG